MFTNHRSKGVEETIVEETFVFDFVEFPTMTRKGAGTAKAAGIRVRYTWDEVGIDIVEFSFTDEMGEFINGIDYDAMSETEQGQGYRKVYAAIVEMVESDRVIERRS